jgi:hypothetical protein
MAVSINLRDLRNPQYTAVTGRSNTTPYATYLTALGPSARASAQQADLNAIRERELLQGQSQFDTSLKQSKDQFDQGLIANREQFDTTTRNQQQQFDTSLITNQANYDTNLAVIKDQFTTEQTNDQTRFAEDLKLRSGQFDSQMVQNKAQSDAALALQRDSTDAATDQTGTSQIIAGGGTLLSAAALAKSLYLLLKSGPFAKNTTTGPATVGGGTAPATAPALGPVQSTPALATTTAPLLTATAPLPAGGAGFSGTINGVNAAGEVVGTTGIPTGGAGYSGTLNGATYAGTPGYSGVAGAELAAEGASYGTTVAPGYSIPAGTEAAGTSTGSTIGSVATPLAIIGAAEIARQYQGGAGIPYDEKTPQQRVVDSPLVGTTMPLATLSDPGTFGGKIQKETSRIERQVMAPIDYIFGDKNNWFGDLFGGGDDAPQVNINQQQADAQAEANRQSENRQAMVNTLVGLTAWIRAQKEKEDAALVVPQTKTTTFPIA